MWVLIRRKLKGRFLEVIRRWEIILRDFIGSIRERVIENKKKKKFQYLKNAIVTMEGKGYYLKNVKSFLEESREFIEFVRLGIKQEKRF